MVAVCEESQAKGTGVERATRRTAGTEVREVGWGVGGWECIWSVGCLRASVLFRDRKPLRDSRRGVAWPD